MEDNNCFCCGAEMEKFKTELYVYHYCFACMDDNKDETKIIQNFAAEYEKQ